MDTEENSREEEKEKDSAARNVQTQEKRAGAQGAVARKKSDTTNLQSKKGEERWRLRVRMRNPANRAASESPARASANRLLKEARAKERKEFPCDEERNWEDLGGKDRRGRDKRNRRRRRRGRRAAIVFGLLATALMTTELVASAKNAPTTILGEDKPTFNAWDCHNPKQIQVLEVPEQCTNEKTDDDADRQEDKTERVIIYQRSKSTSRARSTFSVVCSLTRRS